MDCGGSWAVSDTNLWESGFSGYSVTSASSHITFSEALPSTGSVAVARLDGRELVDENTFFWKISDALLFPAYFGWNWDAVYDCLRDLSWYRADSYLLVFDNAEYVMTECGEERSTFFSVLKRVAKRWADPNMVNSEKVNSFQIVFLCAEDAVQGLRDELSEIV